jgi:hypothetical protein
VRQATACLLLILLSAPCHAQSGAPVAAPEEDDPTRPVTNFSIRPHYENDTTTTRLDRLSLVFRRDVKWELDDGWVLATRVDFPLAFSDAASTNNPDGDYRAGLGRPLVSAYLADRVDDRWAFAFGGQIVAPASASAFGSGNWEVVPILAARYMLPEISDGSFFVPQLRYVASFAQSFAGKSTSNLQFSPQFKIALPQNWFVILFPSTDIRVNLGEKATGQTGQLFLPFDGEVGCTLPGGTVLSLEASAPLVDDYPVYRFKVEARLSLPL